MKKQSKRIKTKPIGPFAKLRPLVTVATLDNHCKTSHRDELEVYVNNVISSKALDALMLKLFFFLRYGQQQKMANIETKYFLIK